MSVIHMGDVRLERNTQENRISVCPVIPDTDVYFFILNSEQLQNKCLDYLDLVDL